MTEEEPATQGETPVKLNRKNITSEVIKPKNYDEIVPENQPEEPATQDEIPKDDGINPIVELLDCGLDYSEEILVEMGYPKLMRKTWNDRGKDAMSKAINAYCPPGSVLGGSLDTPLMALLLGVATLFLCFLPVVQKVMKDRAAEALPEYVTDVPQLPTNAGTDQQATYETPEHFKLKSTAPISDSALSAVDRLVEEP